MNVSEIVRHGLVVLTGSGKDQEFLGSPLVPTVLKACPASTRTSVALRLLALSPHYFIYQHSDRYPPEMPRDQILRGEYERNVASRRLVCDGLLKPHLREDLTVLDFGCGPGYLAQSVGAHCAQVYGVDISRGVLACARVLNARANVTYLHASAEGIPSVGKGSIDLIYSFAVVQHVTDAIFARALAEFRRVLKPSGRVLCHIILEPMAGVAVNGTGAEGRPANGGLRGTLHRKYALHMQARPEASVRTAISDAGFDVQHVQRIGDIIDVEDDIADEHLFAMRAASALTPAVLASAHDDPRALEVSVPNALEGRQRLPQRACNVPITSPPARAIREPARR